MVCLLVCRIMQKQLVRFDGTWGTKQNLLDFSEEKGKGGDFFKLQLKAWVLCYFIHEMTIKRMNLNCRAPPVRITFAIYWLSEWYKDQNMHL